MFLTDFRRISKGALEGLNTNLGGIRHVSTSLPTYFHEFSIPFNPDATFLDPNKFAEKKQQRLHIGDLKSFSPHFRYNPVLSCLRPCSVAEASIACPTHQARKPFYITPCREKNPPSQENYASELHQAMILRLSRVGRTSGN